MKEQLPLLERPAPQSLRSLWYPPRLLQASNIVMPVMVDSLVAAGLQSAAAPPIAEAVSTAMPSLRTLGKLALGGAQLVLAQGAVNPFESCSNPQLSCHNTTVVQDLCCFNAPGGQLLQTQFWDSSPPTGPSDSWTLHGLW